jgi:hypothetical protein
MLIANLVHCLDAKTPVSEAAYGLVLELSSQHFVRKRLWKYENISMENMHLESTEKLVALVQRVLSVMASEPNLASRWSTEVLSWLADSSSTHYTSRGLQIYRALNQPVDQQALSSILAVLYKHLAERSGNDITISLECLVTFEHITANTPTSQIVAFPQLFWISVALLFSDNTFEFRLAIELLQKLIQKFDFANNPSVSSILLSDAVKPKNWEGTFHGIQPLLLKGITAEATLQETLNLFSLISSLIPQHNVFDLDPALRLLHCILGNLPGLLFNFNSEESHRSFDGLAQSCKQMNYPDLSTVFQTYASV